MKKKPILLTLFLLFLTACSVVDSDEQRLESALEFAGKNRYELENVLNHYKNDTWAHFKKGIFEARLPNSIEGAVNISNWGFGSVFLNIVILLIDGVKIRKIPDNGINQRLFSWNINILNRPYFLKWAHW